MGFLREQERKCSNQESGRGCWLKITRLYKLRAEPSLSPSLSVQQNTLCLCSLLTHALRAHRAEEREEMKAGVSKKFNSDIKFVS